MLTALVPAAFAGSWLGRHLLARLPQPVFRKAVFALLILAGARFALM
jgi:uncharacterized membrane protein YfcA